jgi:serine/threonine-protein kinase
MPQPPSSTPPPLPSEGPTRNREDPLVGAVLLDRVRILRHLASGGMGKVYLGEQSTMQRKCAVKVLDPRLAASDGGEFAKRFLLEASVASKLRHPNAVTIFDYGEDENACFIAMEYLEGRTLSDELKRSRRLSPERAVHITAQVCRALREAHVLGVVHRDIKPGNVFLVARDDDHDFVKVLDFGLVKDAHTDEAEPDPGAQIMGSPRYMAPEQVQGKPVDARTDIYSVGAMLYAMLAGKPPFERATDFATMMAQVSDAPAAIATEVPDAELPAGLEAVVMKCLAKKPEDRFASMDELLGALRLKPGTDLPRWAAGAGTVPLLAPPVLPVASMSPAERRALRKNKQRLPAAAMLSVGLIVVVFGLGVAALFHRATSSSQPGAASAHEMVQAAPPPPPTPAPKATLHVETVPPGAKVKEEGETLCEATPCDIVYTGDAAEGGVEHLLVFMKADYKLERKVVTPAGPPVQVKLIKAK